MDRGQLVRHLSGTKEQEPRQDRGRGHGRRRSDLEAPAARGAVRGGGSPGRESRRVGVVPAATEDAQASRVVLGDLLERRPNGHGEADLIVAARAGEVMRLEGLHEVLGQPVGDVSLNELLLFDLRTRQFLHRPGLPACAGVPLFLARRCEIAAPHWIVRRSDGFVTGLLTEEGLAQPLQGARLPLADAP